MAVVKMFIVFYRDCVKKRDCLVFNFVRLVRVKISLFSSLFF